MPLEEEVWKEIIVPIVAEQMGIKEDEVRPDKSLVKDYNADSLDAVEIVMKLEERIQARYNVPKFSIPDEIEPEPQNLGEYRDYIVNRLKPSLTGQPVSSP